MAMLAYWLIPASPYREFFGALIARLAERHDAPPFEPHVSVYAGQGATEDRPGTLIEHVAPKLVGLSLRVDGIGWTDEFTRTLYVEFHDSEPLTWMSDELRRLSARPSTFALRPHLSLMYKTMPSADKQAIARSLQLPWPEITFDEIKAIMAPDQTTCRADVEAWRVVAACGRAPARSEVIARHVTPATRSAPPPGGWPWTEESEFRRRPRGRLCAGTLRSVLLQGYPDLEYGGSADGSVEIIRKYAPWLTYWASEPDGGQSAAINRGLRLG